MIGVAVLLVAIFVYAFMPSGGGTHPAPSQSSSSSATIASPTATVVPTGTPEPSGSYIVYTVLPGDTLSTIADKFHVLPSEILAANPQITDANYIRAGDTINIPRPGSVPSASASSSAS
jgi:LysM repeat protein